MLPGILIHTIVVLTVTAQKNLTPFGRATQSSQSGEGGPRNAILPPISNEWGYDKCTHTDPYKSPAWWMFNISFGPAFVTDIKIYYREQYNDRMDGFKLYISNTSNIPASDYLCYQDSAEGFPKVTETITCNQIGQYIIYYDDKVGYGDFGNVIELCYVAINGCEKHFWGSNCKNACTENCIGQQCYPGNGSCVWGCNAEHCLNDICDKNTAVCTNGCKERRTGRFCNMYNIATDALVSQNPVGSQPAYLANDGDKTSCSKTQGTNVRFYVDMKEIRIVTEIYITGKVNSTKKGVHTIYASNSSVFSEKAIVLYQGESLPTAIGVHAVFRYLTYVPALNNTFLEMEICELGIVGCQSTQYGLFCNKICPTKCRGPCDLESGFCIFGCLDGWVGKKCETACSFGYYGSGCNEQCSVNCMNPRCSHITGECIGGCKSGWREFNCTQECSNGYFGGNCTEFCGGCQSNSCDPLDGLCNNTTACNPGYVHGDYCNKECSNGYFGKNCTNYCWGCPSNMCDPIDGLCINTTACSPGYVYGDYCNQKCSNGRFGENCTDYCWGCLSNLCDSFDGLCNTTTGCSPGYLNGEYCNQTCNDGFYGSGCLEKCAVNCQKLQCNHKTGECIDGCTNGWMGFNCTDECDNGYFGKDCESFCSGCLSNMCNSVDGICNNATACNSGYKYGEYCNELCDDWYFGNNCSSRCNCLIKPCDKETGECPVGGCQTEWHGESCNQVIPKKVINWLAIGGGAAGLIIIVLILLAVCFIYKRKATEDRTNNDYEDVVWDQDDQETTELPPASEHVVYSYNNIPTKDTYCNNKIRIENLKQVINKKQKDCSFMKEFESLPKEIVHPSVEGSKEENKVKNRFQTTLPYDHSRIILSGNTDRDYINASYIDIIDIGRCGVSSNETTLNNNFKKTYDKERVYIAAQGPKRHTVDDFWHMVWQENVHTIVMITQLEEERREKCAMYWPESVNASLKVDIYRLIMTDEKQHTHYMYRKITVSNSSSMDVRTVNQFQFTQWPDHGVPDSIKLVHFYRKVSEYYDDRKGPMIVHCSAGVGRTGTFIAIDALYKNGKNVGYVDVMDFLHMMRKDRMNMIKTYEQYETVFEALLELFTVPKMSIPRTDFSQYIHDIENMTFPLKQKLCNQFEILETLRPSYPPLKFTAANLRENMSKNLVQHILPHDDFRPYLISYGSTRNDYINAVIVPGYRKDSSFFVTQCPIKDTIVDFWTMIYDHDSRIIVLLDPMLESDQLWLERKEMLEFGDLSIIKEDESNVEELKISLNHKIKQDRRVINVFTAKEWQGCTLPSSNRVSDLLKSVGTCRDSQKCPITVVCRDGCSKSGLFVTFCLILDKLDLDEEIDVFQAVRHVQSRRPEFMNNGDQYDYCYKCIKDLLKEQSMDENTSHI